MSRDFALEPKWLRPWKPSPEPFVKADATKFSETGYVGGDVDDLVRDLVQKAEGDIDLAEFGIIYIDEIDKLATRSEMIGCDVSGRGVQTPLLKLMEETSDDDRRIAVEALDFLE